MYFVLDFIFKRGFLDGKAGFAMAFYKMWYFYTVKTLMSDK